MNKIDVLATVGILGLLDMLYWMYFEEVGQMFGYLMAFLVFSWILSKIKIVDSFELKPLIKTYLAFLGIIWIISFLYGFVLGLTYEV